VAGLAVTNSRDLNVRRPEQLDEILRFRVLVAEAKARIAIYGSSGVVSLLDEFLRGGGSMDPPEQRHVFAALCMKMRQDSISSKEPISQENISCLLFDPKLPG
jgi:hypothetical protein